MFTVRVEPNTATHAVYECTRYKVRRQGQGKIISIDDGNGFKDLPMISNGGQAFVMNEQGATIDIIRTK